MDEKKKSNVIPFNRGDKKVDKKPIGYKIGTLFAAICGLCMCSIVVALTAKFIMFLLG